MKTLIKVIVIVFIVMLTACTNTNDEGSQTDNEQNEPTDEMTEENNGDDMDDEEPIIDEPDELEPDPEGEGDQDPQAEDEIVIENEAFKIYEPAPDTEVTDELVVRGLARVFEGTIQYEFEDGHFIIDQGFTTASEGGPGWGEFEINIDLENATNGSYRIVLYEESAKDGSPLHQLIIPVHVNR